MVKHELGAQKRERFLVYGAPALGPAETQAVLECLNSGWIGTGPRVAEFEEAFRSYRGAEAAIAVSSCTAALHLSLIAANLPPGSEVITTPLTFCSTVNAIIHAGLKPVLADVDPATFNIDPKRIEACLSDHTSAIVPVHFGGRPCEMDAITEIARSRGLVMIEDCAHAIESTYHGHKCGTIGEFGCFSFYVTKNVVTGEGGMVLTSDATLADRVKVLALHGMDRDAWKRFSDAGYKHYDVVGVGYKYNMTDLQAAIGIPQLARVEENWSRRRAIWEHYQEEFRDLPVTLPAPPAERTRHAFHLYTILVDEERGGVDRDAFISQLAERNIGAGVHYRSIPCHTAYQRLFGWSPANYPVSHAIGESTVSLPLSAALDDEDVTDVVAAVKASLRGT